MPIYEFQGQEYELSETDPAKAKAKIISHLEKSGQAPAKRQMKWVGNELVDVNDPSYTTAKMAPVNPVLGGDPTNPFSYLSEQQKTEQGPAGKAVSQFVGVAAPGMIKGAVINPLQAAMEFADQPSVLNPGAIVRRVMGGGNQGMQMSADIEKGYQDYRKAAGGEGFDVSQLLGGLVSPTVGAGGTIKNMARAGAMSGVLNPVAKEGMDDVDFAKEKALQAVLGGSLGAGLGTLFKVGGMGFKALDEILKPITESGRAQTLRAYLTNLLGDKTDDAIKAMRSAEEFVPGSRPTAAEAVSDIPETAGLAAYQQRLGQTTGETYNLAAPFSARLDANMAARKSSLGTIARDEDAMRAAVRARADITDPMRDEALKQANIAGDILPSLEARIADKFASKQGALQIEGKLATEAAQQGNLAAGYTPVPGLPRFPGRYSENVERIVGNIEGAKTAKNISAQRQAELDFLNFQKDSLAQNGFFPLRSNDIVDKIDSVLSVPSERASELTKKTLVDIKNKILENTDKNGIIDSGALYTIRKEIGTSIKKFSSETQNWDAKRVAGLETNIKSYIDNALEKSGATSWKPYLKAYSDASKGINQMEVGQYLSKKLNTALDAEKAGSFAQAVVDAAGTIKRSTGTSRFNKLSDVLDKDQEKIVNDVLKDITRAERTKALAARAADQNVLGKEAAQLPNMFSAASSTTNYILRLLKKDANKELNEKAAELLLNPQKLADFLEAIPKQKVSDVAKIMIPKLSPAIRDSFVEVMTIPKQQ